MDTIMNQLPQTISSTDMFRPPINRAMRVLDRAFFQQDVNIAAACVMDSKNIATYRNKLHNNILKLERLPPIRPVPSNISADKNSKCLLLKPDTRLDGSNIGIDPKDFEKLTASGR